MIRIWVSIVLISGALAQNVDTFDTNGGSINKQSSISGELDDGCHDCYKCDHQIIKKYPLKVSKLSLKDDHGDITNVCCIRQVDYEARSGNNCGIRQPNGIFIHGIKQNKTHVRATLKGEYPWRAWIWKKGEATPFCGATVVDANVGAVATLASCALKYPKSLLVVTFDRSLRNAIDVGHVLVPEEHDEETPLVNDIALLFLVSKVPNWVKPACTTTRPPLPEAHCIVMSEEDYFIDTLARAQKMCKVDKKKAHVSQICSTIFKGDYEPEIGSGLFCQDRQRTRTNEYYLSGITMKINGTIATYTNVSHFFQWILEKVTERDGNQQGYGS